MEHLEVDRNNRLKAIKLSMAKEIFDTIEHNRNYLQPWLPFVELTE